MMFRRAAAPLLLARVRLRRPSAPLVLAALGVALAAAGLALLLCAGVSAHDRVLARDLGRLDATSAGVRVVWGGTPAQGGATFPELDRTARGGLTSLQVGRPFAVMVLRETSFHSQAVDLTALDDLTRQVRLRSGRMPQPCEPSRCEVLQLAGAGPVPRIAGLRLALVGQGSVRSTRPFGSLLSRYSSNATLSAAAQYHLPGNPPLFVARGVSRLATAQALAALRRTYAWVVPLGPRSLHPWSLGPFLDHVTELRATLGTGPQVFDVTAPEEELRASDTAGRVGARRLLLLGGAGIASLLAFVVAVGSAGRRAGEVSRRRLTWLGALPEQLLAVEGAEAIAVGVTGAIVGWAAGIGLGAATAAHWNSPVGAVVVHAAASGTGFLLLAAVALVAGTLLVLALRAPELRVGGLTLTLADVAGVAAVVVIAIGLLRGAADAESLAAGNGTGIFLLLLPGLLLFTVAIAAARVLAPALRLLERAGRRASVPLRLSALSLARAPGRAAVAVTFLTVSIGLALFALVYRATLERAQSDEASFAVPRDAIVKEDLSRLVGVHETATSRDYALLGTATDIIRLSGVVPGLVRERALTVLGVPATSTGDLAGWRSDFADASLPELMRRIAPRSSVQMRGVKLPEVARTLELPVELRGGEVKVAVSIATPHGRFVRVELGIARDGRRSLLRGRIPRDARGGSVIGLDFELAHSGNHRGANATTGAQPLARGTMTLAPLRAEGHALRSGGYSSWRGVNGITVQASDGSASLKYFLNPELVTRFVVRQPTDGQAVPVVASPAIAAAVGKGGLVALDLSGERLVVRVVGIARRFPSIDGDLVVADRNTLSTAMNSSAPGSALPGEVWIRARPGMTGSALSLALRQAPFDELGADVRSATEHELRADPLSQGVLLALGVSALAALVSALVGVLILLATDLRDERNELFDLEAQGAAPTAVRRHVRLRVAFVIGFGVVAGIAGGMILAALAVDFVRVTAAGASPQPPILLSLDWPVLLVALAGYGLLAGAIVLGSTRLAEGGRLVRRAEASA